VAGRPKDFDRHVVLQRALDVFWVNGYEATSLDDLTGAMGIGRASLYNEFGDKHSLFIEALERYRGERIAQLEHVLQTTPSARDGIARALRGNVRLLWADSSRRGCLMVNATAERATSDPEVATRAADGFERTVRAFAAALERGKREGDFDETLDVLATARYLANALNGLRLLAKVSDQQVADDVVSVTLGALG
jgi:TetR/AcrR family transcriptional repressor of nem operon